MRYLKLISLLAIVLFFYGSSCNKKEFERETQIIKLLKDKLDIDVKNEKHLSVIVLQDKICGACTEEVLRFIFSLNLKNSVIVLSDDNSELLRKFKRVVGDQKMIIDSTRVIDRYGLRYANDLFVSFDNGRLDYWTFIEEDKFKNIKEKLR